MRLLLIRHGQTPANVRGELATVRPGPGLTRFGRAQADAIPDAVAAEQIAALYISPLLRTAETAAPLAAALGLDPVTLEGLEEIEAGELEDRTDLPSVMTYMTTVFGWARGELDTRMPGGIDGNEFFRRFDAAIAGIARRHPDDTVAVISHGAAIRVWAGARAANLSADITANRHLENTGIAILTGSPASGWLAESWQGEPLGGPALDDHGAIDPLGDPVDEAR
ncbi:MAG TPA: histidine phosphatase family protein [Pseudolysinimonas sp.]|nr:histidine phosphatase family protein [Pseudolysinimonas sp.]